MKKLIALLLVLVLFASLIPAAAADNLDLAMTMIVLNSNESINEGDGEYTYVRHGNLVFFIFRSPATDALAEKAAENFAYKIGWNAMRDAVVEEEQTIRNNLINYVGHEIVFVDCVVSESEPGKLLLAVAEGEVLIDVINGDNVFLPVEPSEG